jgi:haloalkane dehalogenase
MKLLRTPDERFENLPDFPYQPHYFEIDGIRIHYIDEGPRDAEPILLMHGEPTWAYLYRRMIPILIKNGNRCVAPDLVGFGRSDKPTEITDHTYAKHVHWITELVKSIDLRNITLFCQDWGSLIGLRVAAENENRFKRIMLSNGGLPTGDQKPNPAFVTWQKFSVEVPILEISRLIQGSIRSRKLTDEELAAYEAPFPEDKYKAGPRILPSLVPTSKDDPAAPANRKAAEVFMAWNKPFLCAFGDNDPITKGGDRFYINNVPGAKGQKHTTVKDAGHFIQDEKGEEIAGLLVEFIKDNP